MYQLPNLNINAFNFDIDEFDANQYGLLQKQLRVGPVVVNGKIWELLSC